MHPAVSIIFRPLFAYLSVRKTIERVSALRQRHHKKTVIKKGVFKRLFPVCLALLLWLSMGMSVAADGRYLYDESDTVLSPWEEDDRRWAPTAAAVSEAALSIGGKSAVLMEQTTGKVLFEKNPNERLPIASVTKIMTLLLTMEALEGELLRLEDTVTCSKTAASMGGSQIWLEEGEDRKSVV